MGPLHGRDIAQRPLARRHFIGDGGILGRQPEGVPTHGMKHVVPAHPLVARQRVADRVITDVADVQRAAGVGKHLQHVEFGLGGILLGFIEIGVLPAVVPLQLDLVMVVGLFRHMAFGIGG